MLTAILLALGTAALAVVVVAYLNWEKLFNWIRGYEKLVEADRDNLAFSLKEAIDNGKYNVIHGVFNKRSGKIVKGTKVQADTLAPEVLDAHADDLILYPA
ncbi:MAG: hypothetical protein LBR38_03680 [Synergistaceae bacterium]|jgi:hypothetical protein|nr:hypothetical protein [Synergistaceae bacterium]